MATNRQMAKEKSIAVIFQAAIEEFSEKGYTGSTMRSIAMRAGVSNGLINRYYVSKDKLVCQILEETILPNMFEVDIGLNPYQMVCTYIGHIRKLQKEDPVRFRIILHIVNEDDFPDSVYDAIREKFEGSMLETAILKLKKDDTTKNVDAFTLFTILSASICVLLNQYEAIGIEAPDNETLLHTLGYNRDEMEYQRQAEKVARMETDLQLLVAAEKEIYPNVVNIGINLTTNRYHRMEYDIDTEPAHLTQSGASTQSGPLTQSDSATESGPLTQSGSPTQSTLVTQYMKHIPDREGCYDDLVRQVASMIPEETERQKFLELFDRQNLLQAFANGERERSLIHSKTGEDGTSYWVSSRFVMMQGPQEDIIAIDMESLADNHVPTEAEER